MRRRLQMAWAVLRGRSVMYRMKVYGGVEPLEDRFQIHDVIIDGGTKPEAGIKVRWDRWDSE